MQEACPPQFGSPSPPPAEETSPAGDKVLRRTQSAVAFDTEFDWWDDDELRGVAGGGTPDVTPTTSPVKPGHRRHASAAARTQSDGTRQKQQHARGGGVQAPGGRWLERLNVRGPTGAALIVLLSLVLSVMGHSLTVGVAKSASAGAGRLVFVSIAAVSLAVASPVTHGVGGRLHHGDQSGFRFWQPGVGGALFVACQALGWALYSLSVLSFIASCWLLSGALAGSPVSHARWVLPAAFWGAGATGLAAQVTLALSLLAYRPTAGSSPAAAAGQHPGAALRMGGATSWTRQEVGQSLQLHATMMAVLLLVYAPQHLVLSIVASLYLLMPPPAASAVLLVFACGYGTTYVGKPAVTGRRTWAMFQRSARDSLCAALAHWFGGVRVVAAAPHPAINPQPGEAGSADCPAGGATPAAAEQPFVVFGYHPHGLYPAAAAWFHHTPQWAETFPQHSGIVTMGASAIFMTPLLRDVVMWSGARVVSRHSVSRALLHERRSVCLCPGGQAELVLHDAGHSTVLYTRHRGFLRAALEAGAGACPIFVFGEAHTQRNLLRCRSLQRWTAKRLGFPIPFWPGGYLRVLPLPEPVPLTFVVGPILWPSDVGLQPRQQVTAQHVEALHARYYSALRDIFEAHKAEAGFPQATLVLKDE